MKGSLSIVSTENGDFWYVSLHIDIIVRLTNEKHRNNTGAGDRTPK